MVLPASGTLTLSQIQTEFGGSNPVGLSEYYRGGAHVPAWSGTTGVPASGLISTSDFYGALPYPTITNVTDRTNGGTFTMDGLSAQPKFIVAVIANFNSQPYSGVFPTPSVTGVGDFTTVVAGNYSSSSDGHRASIFTIDVGTATSVEVNMATSSSLTVSLFAVNNVTELPVHATGKANGASTTIATSEQGFAAAASVRNFGTMSSASTTCDVVYAYAQGAVGIDTVTDGENATYSLGDGTRYITIAASFAF